MSGSTDPLQEVVAPGIERRQRRDQRQQKDTSYCERERNARPPFSVGSLASMSRGHRRGVCPGLRRLASKKRDGTGKSLPQGRFFSVDSLEEMSVAIDARGK